MLDKELEKIIFETVRSQKQKAFIIQYCNPESETYDNGTQSYLKCYNTIDNNVAAVEAHRLLSHEYIQEAISRYRAYLYEQNEFDLNWLDTNLRGIYYKAVKAGDDKLAHAILKTIGNRLAAFKVDQPDNTGYFIPLTPDEEKIAGRVINEIMNVVKKEEKKD